MGIFGSRQRNPPQNSNCGNVNGSYNNTWNNCDISVTSERRLVLEWLSPLSPQQKHRGVRESRMEGVGDWLLQTDEFINWNAGEGEGLSPVLFCYGDPGVGKTHLSSLVIETLCRQSGGKQVAVACLYCDFRAGKEHSTAHVLGTILRQVASGFEHIPREIEEAFEWSQRQVGGRELGSGEIRELLISTLRALQKSYICIDALDEFPDGHRPDLFEALARVTQESPGTRLFLTGRPQIWDEIKIYFTRSVKVQIRPTKEDIKNYLTMRLSKDPRRGIMNMDLRNEILCTIPKKISEIFLLVSLGMTAILEQSTIRSRRETLKRVTSGPEMDSAYAEALERIKAQSGDKGKLGAEALMWVSLSEEPLSAEELCFALAIEMDSTELDPENVPAIETLLSCCQGLVTIDEGSRVRLMHLTLQEYLASHPDLFGSPHSKMAEVCLTYLNFQKIKDLPPSSPELPETIPFLGYASCYWGVHARKELTERTKSLALQHLDHYDHHVSARLLQQKLVRLSGLNLPTSIHEGRFTSLHAIAYLGIAEIATALVKSRGPEVNEKDSQGFTPLIWAVRNNNIAVCKVLLGLGDADPNIPDSRGETPLRMASAGGYEDIVKLLLEHTGNPDSSNDSGEAPLLTGPEDRHESIVEPLLGYKSNPNPPDTHSATPLVVASTGSQVGTGKPLPKHLEPNPHPPDNRGQILLFMAFAGGHEGRVRLLLEREDVNPNSCDERGRTLLLLAAESGHEIIVKLLLERYEVNPDSSDNKGRKPLFMAAKNGHEGIVKLLLERKDVDPNSCDEHGRTPLLMAAENGHEVTVKLLLGCEGVNPNPCDRYRRTPLSMAAENGHEVIVKLLLGRKGVGPNQYDEHGRTPLSVAAQYGHEVTVKLLLGCEGVNPNSCDKYRQTPLSMAAENGHEGIVMLLLGCEGVNPNSCDKSRRTPLSMAAKNGHEGVVMLLLERDEINPDSSDIRGRTPLSMAAENGHEATMKLLLEHGKANPDSPDNQERTPLSIAAENGHEGIVKLLLKRKDVNPNSCDKRGRTPLLMAAENGYEAIVKLLLGCEGVNPNSSDKYRRTPLSMAAENGHEVIVELLLQRREALS